VIALRGNASTGGTDFIALFVSNKTGKSIWSYVFFGNALMYCVYGVIFGWKYAGYSIIFQFISTHMISAFHHRYDLVTLQATTEKGPEVVSLYIKHFRHGISCVEAVGGYSGRKMYLLNTVISSYEITDAVHVMQEADEHVIINVLKTEQFVGHFYRAPME
ncbi:MAG: YitT family protein, partial [Enterocloster sp.]|nr:YitT family protein [Enterocloster sp.]